MPIKYDTGLIFFESLRFDLPFGVKGQDFRTALKVASIEELNAVGKGKRKKKVQGGNPSKRHRDRLNTELDNLARLLPFPEDTISKLDKISILRLTVSYLKAKSYFQVCATKNNYTVSSVGKTDLSAQFEGNGLMSQLLLEALDGFIMVITTSGQLFYVSESVKDFLGYSQATLIHQSLFKFLHVDDHKSVKENLIWVSENASGVDEATSTDVKTKDDEVFKSSKCERSFSCRIKCTLSHGGGFYKMFQCRGKIREIHIKKRDVDNVEYGLFAVVSPVNTLPPPSTMEMVRKEAMLASQRRLEIDQNLNVAGGFATSPHYQNFLDPHRLRAPVTPNSEPLTPTNPERTFFPPSFTYANGNYLRPGFKRRSSSSSGVNDDSSTNDENASSEGSNEGSGPRRRVSFFLGDEDKATDYGKREKISQRRMSAPTFPSAPVASSTCEPSYSGMFTCGNPNWLFSSPLSNPFLSYQELLHRMDNRPFMSSGLLSPMYPGYSSGGMYPPYSPNPFMKRASSFPNVNPATDPSLLYPGLNGMMGENNGLMSPTMRMHGYDPFSYFMTNPLNLRRSNSGEIHPVSSSSSCSSSTSTSSSSSSCNSNSNKEVIEEVQNKQDEENEKKEPEKNDDDDVEINVTEPHSDNIPVIKVEDFDAEKTLCEDKSLHTKEHDVNNTKTTDDDSVTTEHDSNLPNKHGSNPTTSDEGKESKDDTPGKIVPDKDSSDIQETLADIAQSFTSKLDSIRSSFALSLDRNVASCLGRK